MSPNRRSRRAREALRRFRRGEATPFEVSQYYTPLELVNDSLREERAMRRREQTAWLKQVQTEMEDRLAALGLDRNSWRGLWIQEVVSQEYGDPFKRITICVGGRPSAELQRLLEKLRRRGGLTGPEQDQALWAAAGAWCADDALQARRDAAHQLLVGQYLAVCRANLLLPGRLKTVYALQVRERGAAGGRGGKGKAKRPHTELIRRALVYDAESVGTGDTHWLNGPPSRRQLVDVLRLLEDEEVFAELIHALPRLPLSAVAVDSDAEQVRFEYTDRPETPPVKFRTLKNLISKFLRCTG